jgi:hypothetical protein
MFNLVGCFSILPATELVPGDIVEVGGTIQFHSNDFHLKTMPSMFLM